MVRRGLLLLVGLALVGSPSRAAATYSIAAVDTATGEVGGAGTSCVGNFSVSVIYGSAPGFGVVHAQAYYNEAARNRAVLRLGEGATPAEIITEITSPGFDPGSAQRQYGVVTVDGATAAFTGTDCSAWAGHVTGEIDGKSYSAQGNILTSSNVVDNAAIAFEGGGGCDLADRLMLALEAGALNGEGDSRCTPDGIPSDGAFIRVDRTGEPEWLSIRVDDTAPMNPLVLLREQYDLWRADHSCPVVMPPSDSGVLDATSSGADAGVALEDASAGADASASADAGEDAGAGAEKDAMVAGDGGAGIGVEEPDGCVCLETRECVAGGGAVLWFGLGIGLLLGRLRASRSGTLTASASPSSAEPPGAPLPHQS